MWHKKRDKRKRNTEINHIIKKNTRTGKGHPRTGHEGPEQGVGDQRHARAALLPGKRPCTHFTGSWVGPRPGPDKCGKSRHRRISIPGRPARSVSLYRLSHTGPQNTDERKKKVFNRSREVQIKRSIETEKVSAWSFLS